MSSPVVSFQADDLVRSSKFGVGQVIVDSGAVIVVRFDHGIEACERISLDRVDTPAQALERQEWPVPLKVIARVQAEAIQSVNDTWGVFSRSRIALLPHQLWVCRQVLDRLPARWLIADDVGLGKTIEAGLILWPLLARKRIQRVLILCPASLVNQWCERMYSMFDIRLAPYSTEADKGKVSFWHTHDQVVVSLQTARADSRGRQQRLLESPPWDLLIVDEAHHLNASEEQGSTLGYRLVERLQVEQRVKSMIFFTGTPHRGKSYGFLALLRLLRPDLFELDEPLTQVLPRLREVMIRNNKHNATDLAGKRLFHEPKVTPVTYHFNQAEDRFYAMVTEFITSGKAYASRLGASQGSAVILVLIAMQKLASSSVAAIARAIEGRLGRIKSARAHLSKNSTQLTAWQQHYNEALTIGDDDTANQIDEDAFVDSAALLRLMEHEEERLGELLAAARAVHEETKIGKIMSILDQQFAGRQVLLFTEYKATQSLILSALFQRFGTDCAGFINGDNVAVGIRDSSGAELTLRESREEAAIRFNRGDIRFLVSTEAGGEGIDLQERCHCLIHADLPWNPMRLHQRVGRLNRYGQQERVEVIVLHNPDTVESLIWDKLNTKIESIQQAFSQVMEQPEDLLQLVLGMASPSLFREVFSEATSVPRDSFSQWFDQRTGSFGGRDAIATVKDLVGNAAKFDFQQVAPEIPRVDLPDLRPFMLVVLTNNQRRVTIDENGMSFVTPEPWKSDLRIRATYKDLIFDRNDRSADAASRILGVGHALIDAALDQALKSTEAVTSLPISILPQPLFLFRVTDQVTGLGSVVRAVLFGIEGTNADVLLRDWQVLQRLNDLLTQFGRRRCLRDSAAPSGAATVREAAARAQRTIENRLPALKLSISVPRVDLLAVLWPISGSDHASSWEEVDVGED